MGITVRFVAVRMSEAHEHLNKKYTAPNHYGERSSLVRRGGP